MEVDYYSWAPLLRLKEPLVLCGIAGADVSRTARMMNLLSGVPFLLLDRRVEHELGRSVELEQDDAGSGPRLEIERTLIRRMIDGEKRCVVATSEVTFTDRQLKADLLRWGRVIHLHIEPEEAVDRIFARALEDPRNHWALLRSVSHDRSRLLTTLKSHQRRYRDVNRVTLVGGRGFQDVARGILEELGYHRPGTS